MATRLPAIDPLTWFTKWKRWADVSVLFTSSSPFAWEWRSGASVVGYAFDLLTLDTGDIYPVAAPSPTYPQNSQGDRNFWIGEPGNFLPAVLPGEYVQRSMGYVRLLLYFGSETFGPMPLAVGTYNFECSGTITFNRAPRSIQPNGYWLNIWRDSPTVVPGIDIPDYSASVFTASMGTGDDDKGVMSFSLNVVMTVLPGGDVILPDGTYFALDMTF